MDKKHIESRKQQIKDLFLSEPDIERTCVSITKYFIEKDSLVNPIAIYLSGSISSILNNLIKEGFLEYSYYRTRRGGHIYQLKTK